MHLYVHVRGYNDFMHMYLAASRVMFSCLLVQGGSREATKHPHHDWYANTRYDGSAEASVPSARYINSRGVQGKTKQPYAGDWLTPTTKEHGPGEMVKELRWLEGGMKE
jgi:hypothetical protein